MPRKTDKNQRFIDALLVLNKVFEKHNIFFWLEAGTLLGAVRDKKMIPWDDDCDISIWLEDVLLVINTQEDFQSQGYEIYLTNGHYGLRDIKNKEHLICIFLNKDMDGYIVKLKTSPFVPLKFFISLFSEPDYKYYKQKNIEPYGDHMVYPRYYLQKTFYFIREKMKMSKHKRKKLVNFLWKLIIDFKLYKDVLVRSPTKYLGNCTKIKFYNQQFYIPEDFDSYLSFRFKNWRIPMRGDRGVSRNLKEVTKV